MSKPLHIAVVGATGLVGECMLTCLSESDLSVAAVYPIASEQSRGKTVFFRDKAHKVQSLSDFDFTQVDLALFAAGESCAETYVEKATCAGALVIDNSAYFRQDNDVPLVIPEVNPQAIEQAKTRRIIANPNCSTIQLLVGLQPMMQLAGIQAITVATYQSVSGSGQQGIEALAAETSQLLSGAGISDARKVYQQQIAFNLIPCIGTVDSAHGYSTEEMKVVAESRKILAMPELAVNVTAVRVPVFFGHSEVVHATTALAVDHDTLAEAYRVTPGITFCSAKDAIATPVNDAANHDAVFVSRLRKDLNSDLGWNLWIVADNVRKGAALNAIQIASCCVADGFI